MFWEEPSRPFCYHNEKSLEPSRRGLIQSRQEGWVRAGDSATQHGNDQVDNLFVSSEIAEMVVRIRPGLAEKQSSHPVGEETGLKQPRRLGFRGC